MRDQFVAGGLSRGEVNRRTRAVRRLFKWAVGRELVPPGVLHALQAVEALRKGRSPAPDPDPVRPVAEADVAATLPYLPSPVRAMVEVQQLTGMRPGEVCGLRPVDIDQSGKVWVYRPPHHKTSHAGRDRAVPIGPRAQGMLARLTPADPAAYYFDPRTAVAEEREARSSRRVTPRSASKVRRSAEAVPKRAARPKYSTGSYGRAVARGVVKANASRRSAAERSGVVFVPIQHWQPNQLRHAHATLVRRLHGIEAAQVILGHARADVTQLYAERDLGLALRVAGEIG